MIKVVCKDNSNLPQGAELNKDEEYIVIDDFQNSMGERTYILLGINNEGKTALGFPWRGYKATRFRISEDEEVAIEEFDYNLN